MASRRSARLDRREFLVLLGAGGGAALLAGCQVPTGAPTVATPTVAPVDLNATITYAIARDPNSLDPGVTAAGETRSVLSAVFDPIIFADADDKLHPKIATSWTPSSDGLRWTLKLRKGVTFHDGTPLDAAAVKFMFDRSLDTKVTPALTGAAQTIRPVVKSANIVGEDIELVLNAPFPALPMMLAKNECFVPSPKAIQDMGGAAFARKPIGSGPYIFKEWIAGQRIVVERNEKYWDAPARSRQLVFLPVTEETTRVAMVESGQADMMQYVTPRTANQLRTDPRFQVLAVDVPDVRSLRMNQLDEKLKNVKVRQAFNYAVNINEVIETVFQNAATRATGPMPIPVTGSLKEPKFKHDPAIAKRLLGEAGYPNGFTTNITFSSATGAAIAEAMALIQAQLKVAGIEMQLRPVEAAAYAAHNNLPASNPAAREKQLTYHGSIFAYNDPSYLARGFDSRRMPPNGTNYNYYSNPEVDRLFDQGLRETDPAKISEVYTKISEIIAAEPPAVFAWQDRLQYLTSKKIRGVRISSGDTIEMAFVEKLA